MGDRSYNDLSFVCTVVLAKTIATDFDLKSHKNDSEMVFWDTKSP
jgi:hypothetical protein